MDALSHSLEAFCSPFYHPLAEGVAVEGMRSGCHVAAISRDGRSHSWHESACPRRATLPPADDKKGEQNASRLMGQRIHPGRGVILAADRMSARDLRSPRPASCGGMKDEFLDVIAGIVMTEARRPRPVRRSSAQPARRHSGDIDAQKPILAILEIKQRSAWPTINPTACLHPAHCRHKGNDPVMTSAW